MDNYLLFKFDENSEKLSKELGFEHTFFLGRDIEIISGNPNEIIRRTNSASPKITIYFAEDDKKLRFVLERTNIKMVLGMEFIFSKDSVHFPKSGLDQVLCKIAAERNKIIGFSVSEILNAKNPAILLKRMAFNINLCKKYHVPVIVGNFSKNLWEMRSASDLDAFRRMLEKKKA